MNLSNTACDLITRVTFNTGDGTIKPIFSITVDGFKRINNSNKKNFAIWYGSTKVNLYGEGLTFYKPLTIRYFLYLLSNGISKIIIEYVSPLQNIVQPNKSMLCTPEEEDSACGFQYNSLCFHVLTNAKYPGTQSSIRFHINIIKFASTRNVV